MKYKTSIGTNFSPEIIRQDERENPVLRVFKKAGNSETHVIEAEGLKDAREKANKLAANKGMEVTGLWLADESGFESITVTPEEESEIDELIAQAGAEQEAAEVAA
jgi:hypothetical protein